MGGGGPYASGHYMSAQDRLNMNAALAPGPISVNTDGEMSVKVSAPAGTQVRTGGALFKRVRTQRNIQLPDTNSPVPQQQTPFA
jgi:hypothetical protein